MWKYILTFLLFSACDACSVRQAQYGKICICNSTYCDKVQIGIISPGTIKAFLTSDDSPGFNIREIPLSDKNEPGVNTIKLNRNITYQKIIGFGGAFTDSTGHNIKLLPEAAQEKLMESYFSDQGIEYNMARVPIGGSDFSPSFYSLDEYPDDMELKHFALSEEDINHKLPFMKKAFALRNNKPLKLFTSIWKIPSWMLYKPGYSIVKKTHYQVYAEYYKKYFDEYAKHGINFWGMTTQNEATSGLLINGLAGTFWVPQELNIWIRDHLGPTLRNSSHDIRIIILDDNWEYIPFVAYPIIHDGKTIDYVDGIAVHWYSYGSTPPEVLNIAKSPKKEIFFMNSEACYFIRLPNLGDWSRASNYAAILINHLNDGFSSWIDWNLAVNSTGGPNNMNLPADAPIVISADAQEFYKQPYFYVYGHFTKFIPPGSVRINLTFTRPNRDVRAVAFLRPDNLISVTVYNMNTINPAKVQINDQNRYSQVIDVPRASIQTFLFY